MGKIFGTLVFWAFLPNAVLAQENSSVPTVRFSAERNATTGSITLRSEDEKVEASLSEKGTLGEEGLSFVTKPSEGYAHFGQNGDLVEVFAAPVTGKDTEYLLGKLEAGGSIKKVGFWDNAPKLPTREEAKQITEASINAALGVICQSNPRPEDMRLEVEIAASLGLEGRFALSMDWKPARDCID